MKRLACGGLTALFILPFIPHPACGEAAGAASRQAQAISLYRAKRYAEAVPLYRQLAHEQPNDPAIHLDLLWTLWNAQQYRDVIHVADRLSDIEPANDQAWSLRGRAHYALGQWEEALKAFQKSLELEPRQFQLELDMGRLEVRMRQYKPAIRTFKRILVSRPESVDAWRDLAKTQFLAGLFSESARSWARVNALVPPNPDYQFQETQALYFSGKQERALARMKRILHQAPGHRATTAFLVDTAIVRNDLAGATALLEQTLGDPSPEEEPRYLRLAAIYQERGDFEWCARTLERVLAAAPTRGAALLMQADCLKERGRIGPAEERYERVLEHNAWSFRAIKALASIQAERQRPARALEIIRQARALDPTDPALLFLEAEYLYDHGDRDSSNAMLRDWLAANPGPSLPVLLYHGLTPHKNDPLLAHPIHASQAAFEDHMRALKQAGYTPVKADQVQDWLQGEENLPARPILITFDDARRDSFVYGDPVLKKYDLRATMMVALANVQRDLPGFASWPEMKAWQRSGRWEMQAHANLGHTKIPVNEAGYLGLFLPNKRWLDVEKRLETDEEWTQRIAQDTVETNEAMIAHFGKAPTAFAFPEGDYGQDNWPNVTDAAPHLVQQLKTFYGSMYHQDNLGFNTRTRNPLFLRRVEPDPQWTGRDLLRHLSDRDPCITARRALFRQALWQGKMREATQWLADLKKSGASPAVLLADQARLRSAMGDEGRASALALQALAHDPKNREIQQLVKSLQDPKTVSWQPEFEYMEDNDARQNWLFHQTVETLRAGRLRWRLNHFYGAYKEPAVSRITDQGAGLGVTAPLGRDHSLSFDGKGHAVSGGGEATYSLAGSVRSMWTDDLETTVIGNRAPYPTASALNARIWEQGLEGQAAWNPDGPWDAAFLLKGLDFSDENQRYGGYVQFARSLGSTGLSAGYRGAADHTEHVSPFYYSPQDLHQHQLVLRYIRNLGGGLQADVQYLPGYGYEKAASGRFVQNGQAGLNYEAGKSVVVRPAFSFTQTPTYRSQTYRLSLGFLF